MFDVDRYEWLSFDCYGTLVDWESGICRAVRDVFASYGTELTDPEILCLFSEIEPKVQQSSSYLDYRQVLNRVMVAIGMEIGVDLSEADAARLAGSLPEWPVFPDVVGALLSFKSRYKLAVISNVDDDLFSSTVEAIGVDFDVVVTAQQVGSYKPDLHNFTVAAERMGVDRTRWLHVAESLYHDVAPANRLGIASVWVNRSGRGGGTRVVEAHPDIEVADLAELATFLCHSRG